MKKTLFLIAAGIMMIATAQAQNSVVEAEQQFKQTKIEQFLKTNHYIKQETVYVIKQDNFVMRPVVLTNLLTGEKIAGVECGAFSKDSKATLGFYDFEEIDDVVKVLDDILALSKTKLTYKETYIQWTSLSGIEIHYDAKAKETWFRKKWKYINQYGVVTEYYQSTDDTNIGAVADIRKDLLHAKTLLEEIIAK